MSGTALVRPITATLWELRSAWASGKRVALSLDERCTPRRVEGHVSAVAATGAYVRVAGLHVPDEAILAVHLPSILGDSTARDGQWHGPGHGDDVAAGQLVIDYAREAALDQGEGE